MLTLSRGEALDAGLTRIARETTARAVAHLTDSEEDIATRPVSARPPSGALPRAAAPTLVHETRKRFKEIRAVIRLGRFARGDRFSDLNAAFRDAALELARLRDTEALLAMAESLRHEARDALERRAVTRVARLLAAGENAPAADALAAIAARLPDVSFAASGTRWLERGLRRTYRDARRAFRRARDERTATAIHAWRKRVKDLWYQTQIVAPAWPELMDVRADALHALSRLLGEHHDLWLLEVRMIERDNPFGRTTARRFTAIIQRRLAEVEAAIFDKGALVHAETPRAWSESIVRYWRVWTDTL